MPNYKYVCTNENCHKEIEITCSMKNYSSTVQCDICDSIAERKIEDLICGASIDITGDFYRKVN